MPQYAAEPSYLSAVHCRLCDPPKDLSDDVRAEDDQHVCEIDADDGDVCNSVHPAVKRHLKEHHHDMSPQQYREHVLGRVVADWPEPVAPQVLRTRLTEYKRSLSDAVLQMDMCACCACAAPKSDLMAVQIYSNTVLQAPKWLGWSNDNWSKYGATWMCQMNDIFSTESYLDWYFEAQAHMDAADEKSIQMGERCRQRCGA